MAKKTFNANLFSLSDLKQLKKDLEDYKDDLQVKCTLIAEKLAQKGVEISKIQIQSLDAVFTGDLLNSIRSEYVSSDKDSATFMVIADNEHAVFVEFGTGIVGKQSPYTGDIPINWDYASGKSIGYYEINGQMLYGWFYYDANKRLRFTQGMPSRPFMTNTSKLLEDEIADIVKSVFK